MDSRTLGKRDCETEALAQSIDIREPKRFHGEETDREPKRFHSEETDRFLDLLQLDLDQTLADDDDEEFAPSEELVNGVMRSLEEEIAATCSTSCPAPNSGDKLDASHISSGHEERTLDGDSGVDLGYLLEASDDDLGIPPSPVLDSKVEVCTSPKEISEVLSDSSDLKSLGDNWHYEDDFDNYHQFKLYEDEWDANQLLDYMSRDFLSQGLLFDGDFSEQWRLETAGGM